MQPKATFAKIATWTCVVSALAGIVYQITPGFGVCCQRTARAKDVAVLCHTLALLSLFNLIRSLISRTGCIKAMCLFVAALLMDIGIVFLLEVFCGSWEVN